MTYLFIVSWFLKKLITGTIRHNALSEAFLYSNLKIYASLSKLVNTFIENFVSRLIMCCYSIFVNAHFLILCFFKLRFHGCCHSFFLLQAESPKPESCAPKVNRIIVNESSEEENDNENFDVSSKNCFHIFTKLYK